MARTVRKSPPSSPITPEHRPDASKRPIRLAEHPGDHVGCADHDERVGAFVRGDDPTGKLFGLGLAVAVFLDATLVRLVLVPATMSLIGRANWWLPAWLDRILPHLDFEGRRKGEAASPDDEPELDPERELVGV